MIEPEKFLHLFSTQFDEKAQRFITLNTAFKQMEGWSSLQALIITVAVHDEWGISFTDDDFKNSTTVNDLLNITQQKLA